MVSGAKAFVGSHYLVRSICEDQHGTADRGHLANHKMGTVLASQRT
jgi:hypothetical protein